MMSIFVPAVVLSVLFSILAMVYAAIKRNADKSFFFMLFSVVIFLYTFGYLLEIQSESMEAALYGVRVQYMGLPLILPIAYLFLRDIYGERHVSLKQAILLLAVPILTIGSVQLYPMLRLYYKRVDYIANNYIANCRVYPGPLYYVSVLYTLLIFGLIVALILRRFRGAARRQRRQDLALLAAILVPLGSSLSYLVFNEAVRYDPTPICASISLALLLYAVGYNNLLNVVPMARVRVIEDMQDALVICDSNLNFLDANRAAKVLFPALRTFQPGDSMEQLANFKREGELWLPVEGRVRFFKVTQTHIMEGLKHSGSCIVFHDITEKEQLLKKLHIQATFDPLLHVYNRATFFDMANLVLSSEEAKDTAYAVLMLDIDHFKPVNDTYGHPCGDTVLENIAVLVKGHFRKGDLVGRYGGEEIVVLLENLTAGQAVATAEKLRQIIARTAIYCQQETVYVTISIGVAHSPAGEPHMLDQMVAQADAALYRAKNHGRNQVCL